MGSDEGLADLSPCPAASFNSMGSGALSAALPSVKPALVMAAIPINTAIESGSLAILHLLDLWMPKGRGTQQMKVAKTYYSNIWGFQEYS
jgi:hypothetical protein